MRMLAEWEKIKGNRFGIDLLWVALMDYALYDAPGFYHDHGEGVYHYMYIISGEGRMDIDGETFYYAPEQIYMTAPGVKHVFSVNAETPLVAVEMKFRISDSELDSQMRKLPKYIDCRENTLGKLATEIYRENSKQMPLYREVAEAKAYELFCLLQRAAVMPSITTLETEFLEPVRQYVRKNLSCDITLVDLAEQVSLEKIYFSKRFKILTGMSPMEYVRKSRIEKAKELIVSSDMNITQISQALGFQSLQHFSNTFMRLVGCSPRVFKQTHQLR